MLCTHPDAPLVVTSGSDWTAVCKQCGQRWTSRDENVPEYIQRAVEYAREMSGGNDR